MHAPLPQRGQALPGELDGQERTARGRGSGAGHSPVPADRGVPGPGALLGIGGRAGREDSWDGNMVPESRRLAELPGRRSRKPLKLRGRCAPGTQAAQAKGATAVGRALKASRRGVLG